MMLNQTLALTIHLDLTLFQTLTEGASIVSAAHLAVPCG